jgi:hypothetical protein
MCELVNVFQTDEIENPAVLWKHDQARYNHGHEAKYKCLKEDRIKRSSLRHA